MHFAAKAAIQSRLTITRNTNQHNVNRAASKLSHAPKTNANTRHLTRVNPSNHRFCARMTPRCITKNNLGIHQFQKRLINVGDSFTVYKGNEEIWIEIKQFKGAGVDKSVYIADRTVSTVDPVSGLVTEKTEPCAVEVVVGTQPKGFLQSMWRSVTEYVSSQETPLTNDSITTLTRTQQRVESCSKKIEKVAQHPNTHTTYMEGPLSTGRKIVSTTELLDGDITANLTGEISFALVLAFLQQCASATQHIHNQGFVHCDIKPLNLFIKDMQARVGDLDTMTEIGGHVRTFSKIFAAPEIEYVAEQARIAHPRQDSYSLLKSIDVLMEVFAKTIQPRDPQAQKKQAFIGSIRTFCHSGLESRPSANEIEVFLQQAQMNLQRSGIMFDELGDENLRPIYDSIMDAELDRRIGQRNGQE